MLSGKEVHVLDKNSEYYGVPTSRLMENAGKAVADFIIKNIKPSNKSVIVFCGTGNNGGDGFVAARYLHNKFKVSVFLTGKETKTDIAKENLSKLKDLDIEIYTLDHLDKIDNLLTENDIIIDAMLGIGLLGDLREPFSLIVKKILTKKNKTIVSIDIPTGLGTNLAIKPNYTITFHDVKLGVNKTNSGEIRIFDIGIPKKADDYVGPGELSVYYPRPKKDSHKGDNGKVLVVGGGPYIGAPALSGLAALRTGADLAYIAAPGRAAKAITSVSQLIKPKGLAGAMALHSLNLIVKELSHEQMLVQKDIDIIETLIKKIDTMVIGPGLGSDKTTKHSIEKILLSCVQHKKSMVIDADAIQVVGENPNIVKHSQTVSTPHAGEFYDLTGIRLSDDIDKRKNLVEKWAKKIGVTILLKGSTDIISDGTRTKLNDIHNPAMTVGGTGDVLAGIIGALLSKKVEPFNAAGIAAFLNGEAGNEAFKKKSYGLLATDIIEEIPSVLKKYL
jgi:NAD(P)H-hydrate epimerase